MIARPLSSVLLLLASACASGGGVARTRDLGQGSFELECSSALPRCAQEAEQRCGGRGYDVLEGYDQSRRYGHEAGESQVEVRTSRLVIVCRSDAGEPRVTPAAETAPAQPPARSPAPTSSAPPPACTPGTTQQCFGPGACRGGQSCLPDGAGYGACDCGNIAPQTVPAPSTAP